MHLSITVFIVLLCTVHVQSLLVGSFKDPLDITPDVFDVPNREEDDDDFEPGNKESARDLAQILMQVHTELTQNTTDLTDGVTEVRAGGIENPKSMLDEFRERSEDLMEEMRALETESANRTGIFMQEMRLQSLAFMEQMHALQQQSANLKAGPAHAYPQIHVAERRSGSSKDNRKHKSEIPGTAHMSGMSGDISGSSKQGLDILGGGRTTLTGLGICLFLISGFMVAQKKGAVAPKHSTCRPGASQMCSHGIGGEEGKSLTVWDGTVATFSSIVGTGLLTMPYAFSLAGLIAVPVVIFFQLCSCYTAHLMAWALNARAPEAERLGIKPEFRGWPFLVETAFGTRAKCAINIFLIVELWGYLLSCVVTSTMNLMQIAQDMSDTYAAGISVVIVYGLTFVPARLLTRVNVISNGLFAACCLMFLITGLLLPAKAPSSDIKFVNASGLFTAAGILIFSPAAHSFYPAVMQRMEEPGKYPVCLRQAYLTAAVLYLAVAVPGYLLFGNAAQASLVRNIGADLRLMPLPDLGWMNTFAALSMVVKMFAMSSLVLTPLASTIEGCLSGHRAEALLTTTLIPMILAVSAAMAVHFAHEMATLLNLIGSVFCMNIAFVVPVMCYWKLTTGPVDCMKKSIFVFLIIMGSSFAVMGVLLTF